MIDVSIWLLVGVIMIPAGALLGILSWYKVLRRWYVVKIRMPLMRRLKYRPSRPKADHYILDNDDAR